MILARFGDYFYWWQLPMLLALVALVVLLIVLVVLRIIRRPSGYVMQPQPPGGLQPPQPLTPPVPQPPTTNDGDGSQASTESQGPGIDEPPPV